MWIILLGLLTLEAPEPERKEWGLVYGGLPKAEEESLVLKNQGYVAGYSEERRSPLWVGYKLFAVEEAPTHKRPGRFSVDKRTEIRVKHDDYTNTGYDRGHMAPNHAIAKCYGKAAQKETFLMSNVTPQKPKLNRHPWRLLEQKIIKEYAPDLEEVWVITGPIFTKGTPNCLARDDGNGNPVTPSYIDLPDAFYKIIIDETETEIRALAIIMKQTTTEPTFDKYLTTIDEVERLTGVDFLADLPDSIEEPLEAKKAAKMWETN